MKLDAFKDKRVLVTGHTGFKGSWLATWLHRLGARVAGYALEPPTEPSLYEAAGVGALLETEELHDIRDIEVLTRQVAQFEPDIVMHLAAQPLVSLAFADPRETFDVNVMGTCNVLEVLRSAGRPCVAVMVTSDKCYDNVGTVCGYREDDKLGGKDPYSGSKGAAELVIRSYCASYLGGGGNGDVRVGVGRAGNVIGGGDWAQDRIVPDCVRAWSNREPIALRSPEATRPWQHVLEPLSGYLALAIALHEGKASGGEAFNFGPPPDQLCTVEALTRALSDSWGEGASWTGGGSGIGGGEARLLKLCIDKALHLLDWKPTLGLTETAEMTAGWYRDYYQRDGRAADLIERDIDRYCQRAAERGVAWAGEG